MLRPGRALVILPKAVFEGGPPGMQKPLASLVHEPQLRSGVLKFARFKALNISAWKRSLNRSVRRNCLRIEKSQVCKFGPRIMPTPSVPRRSGGAAINAAWLTQGLQLVVQELEGGAPGSDTKTGPPM